MLVTSKRLELTALIVCFNMEVADSFKFPGKMLSRVATVSMDIRGKLFAIKRII